MTKLKGRFRLIIVDQKAFDRFWIGKRPVTREAFLEWLDGSDSLISIAYRRQISGDNLKNHSGTLRGLGILKRVIAEEGRQR